MPQVSREVGIIGDGSDGGGCLLKAIGGGGFIFFKLLASPQHCAETLL